MDKLAKPATNGGTYIVTCNFDENGTAVTPKSVAWTLMDYLGDVVNGRSAVVETPAATVYIICHGADITLSGTDNEMRLLTVSAMYDSDTYGDDLVLRKTFQFKVVR